MTPRGDTPWPLTRSARATVQFLTVAQVADRLRVPRAAVYRLVHGGQLPAARVGRSFRVPLRAVEDRLRAAPARRRATDPPAGGGVVGARR